MGKRIGIISRCDNTGLGIQSKEFYDHIPCKALVVDIGFVNSAMKQNHDWYPGQPVVYYHRTKRLDIEKVKKFLSEIDVLIAFETPYDYSIFGLCKLMGIKTILQLNYEFLEYPSLHQKPDLFLAPSMWHYDKIPELKMFLPVPVAAEKFTPLKKHKQFLHIGGKPAIHDRNGTMTLLGALRYVKNEISLEIKCQNQLNVPKGLHSHINLKVDCGNRINYWENYSGGVLVMPRKYGGLCLPCNEGLAAGMPVIMPDISPNNTWLPGEWVVPAQKTGAFMAKKRIDIYETNPEALAEKIDKFCDEEFYNDAFDKAIELKNGLSWQHLFPKYLEVINGL